MGHFPNFSTCTSQWFYMNTLHNGLCSNKALTVLVIDWVQCTLFSSVLFRLPRVQLLWRSVKDRDKSHWCNLPSAGWVLGKQRQETQMASEGETRSSCCVEENGPERKGREVRCEQACWEPRRELCYLSAHQVTLVSVSCNSAAQARLSGDSRRPPTVGPSDCRYEHCREEGPEEGKTSLHKRLKNAFL